MTAPPGVPALARHLAAIAGAPRLLVATDYDGTLAPIAPRPESAELLSGARPLLAALAALPATRVAVVSGRALGDLQAHSGITPPVLLVGSHGAEWPDGATDPPSAAQRARLDELRRTLGVLVATAPGAWIEEKPFAIAVHTRAASRGDAARLLHAVRAGPAVGPDLHVREGKEVIELALSPADKGAAIRRLRGIGDADPVVCYLGDDLTDEAVFATLRPDDVGVKVGAGPTRAAYRVACETDALGVLALLHRLRAGVGDDVRADP
ncbi:MAG: trehalose-phosphatase [Chloroflexota bacterium]